MHKRFLQFQTQQIRPSEVIVIKIEIYQKMNEYSVDQIQQKAFKVILVGVQSVGKSSILYRLIQSKFNSSYLATVGIDFKAFPVTLGNKIYSLQIWDTAGQQKFRALTSAYFKGSHACVCVFDLNNPDTLQKCDYYIDKAIEQQISKECIFLVGNKSDLGLNNQHLGKEYAAKFGIQYKSVSALDGSNVVQLFNELTVHLAGNFGDVSIGNSGGKQSKRILRANQYQNRRKCEC